ncbi:MAG: hypothetical protein JWO53_1290, partial [Chlamydiia bacterium]|nr:hypothetical protein [Chlamydiia bacterium]
MSTVGGWNFDQEFVVPQLSNGKVQFDKRTITKLTNDDITKTIESISQCIDAICTDDNFATSGTENAKKLIDFVTAFSKHITVTKESTIFQKILCRKNTGNTELLAKLQQEKYLLQEIGKTHEGHVQAVKSAVLGIGDLKNMINSNEQFTTLIESELVHISLPDMKKLRKNPSFEKVLQEYKEALFSLCDSKDLQSIQKTHTHLPIKLFYTDTGENELIKGIITRITTKKDAIALLQSLSTSGCTIRIQDVQHLSENTQ